MINQESILSFTFLWCLQFLSLYLSSVRERSLGEFRVKCLICDALSVFKGLYLGDSHRFFYSPLSEDGKMLAPEISINPTDDVFHTFCLQNVP